MGKGDRALRDLDVHPLGTTAPNLGFASTSVSSNVNITLKNSKSLATDSRSFLNHAGLAQSTAGTLIPRSGGLDY